MKRSSGPYWAVVETKHAAEHVVSRKLREQGFETFLPMYRARRAPRRLAPLFPRYIFVRIVDDIVSGISGTRGVLRMLMMSAETPARIAGRFVVQLRARQRELGYILLAGENPPVRDLRGPVRATAGKMIGQRGLAMGMTTADRLRVMFVMMGREVSVEMQRQDLVAA